MSFRPWAFFRRLQYGFGFLAFWGLLGTFVYINNTYVPANCIDGMFNGEETGVDCGGGCVQVCKDSVIQPFVTLSEVFKVSDNQYNIVGYIENPNQTVGATDIEYTFELFSDGLKVGEESGSTELPPNTDFPVFHTHRVDPGVEIDDVEMILGNVDFWLPASYDTNKFTSGDRRFSDVDERPRLVVDIENNDVVSAAENVEVVTTIFNELNEPVTTSQTYVEYIGPLQSEQAIFTWPNPLTKTVRSCVIPIDVILAIDLSGSMNNDGGDPAQPVTSALAAAGEFARSLKDDDQIGVVTFATEAGVSTQLTNELGLVANSILGLSIKPSDETGYTNTIDALRQAGLEANSERHNTNARRVLIILTDGLPTAKNEAGLLEATAAEAARLTEEGLDIYSIGLGQNVDKEFLGNIASSPENAYLAPTGDDLSEIYTNITSSLCESGPAKIDVVAKTQTNFEDIRP